MTLMGKGGVSKFVTHTNRNTHTLARARTLSTHNIRDLVLSGVVSMQCTRLVCVSLF